MASKRLQGIGVLALVALVGGSVAALMVVKQRIHVTVADEEAAAQRGPDPLELLRADVSELKGDVASLSEGVGNQLQALHGALEESATTREQALAREVAELKRQLQALAARADQSAGELAQAKLQLEERLYGLANGLQSLSTAVANAPAIEVTPPPVVSAPPPVEIPVVTQVDPPPQSEATPPTPAAEPAAGDAKKGFLSFKLPSQTFAFDKLQKLSIVPSLSRVGFDAKSTLHDFSGVTQKVEGELVANLAKPNEGCKGTLAVDAGSLDTGLADRDAEMRKQLDSAKHASMRFVWTAFKVDSSDAALMKVSGTASGQLTIKGTTRDVSMPVRISVDASKRVSIEGETKIKMSDFGVKPPSQLGLISVEDELKLWIALRARSLGAVEESKP